MPQSLAQLLIHIVFSTKGHKPFLQDAEIREKLHAYITGICKNIKSNALIVGGTENHIHILASLSKSSSVSEVVRTIKSNSTNWMKSEYNDQFQWQSGYGAFSVSKSKENDVKAYIRNQMEHHKKFSFKKEFRKLLERHGVEYDEQYVWD